MKSNLRILVLAQYFTPDMGGASTRASNVVKGLLKNGYDVTIVTAFPHYPLGKIAFSYKHKAIVSELFRGSKVFRVWVPSLPHNNVVNRLTLHLSFVFSSLFALPFVGKVDAIWAANPNLFSFFPGFIYGVTNRAPLIRNVDDLWPEVFYELGYVKSHFFKKILNFLAWISYVIPIAISPISNGYKRSIVRKYGINPQKVHVVEVGVENVNPISSKSPRSKFIIMYSGVLGLGYDFDVILKAAKILENNDKICFIIRGVGEKVLDLQKSINHLCLKNVVLDNTFLSLDKLNSLLDSADVFILPMADMSFVNLGLPTKVFEYQSYGKPIICVSDGEPAHYVRLSKSGIVVRPHDAKAFAEAVTNLYRNRNLCKKLGSNGRDYVSKNLTTKRIGERFHDIFTAAIH